MALSWESARSIFVTRDDVVGLADAHGIDSAARRLLGALVKAAPEDGAAKSIGMIAGAVELPAATQPTSAADRLNDAISSSDAVALLLPDPELEDGKPQVARTATVVKMSLVVSFSGRDRMAIGLGQLANDAMTPAEHAAFAGRMSRSGSGLAAVDMLSPEAAAAVRRRLGRAQGSVVGAKYTVTVAELGQQLNSSTSAASSGALVRRLMLERDRYRELVAAREAELAALVASIPRQREEAVAAVRHRTDAAIAERDALQRRAHELSTERVALEAAFDSMEATVEDLQQRNAQVVAAANAALLRLGLVQAAPSSVADLLAALDGLGKS